ncbi:alpha/beta hydrolase [Streptomyces yaizuensis]|uniref:Alpha/beta hydrolase n=1 Tax=Streptomyces yaizuensis TaxID=2989713 RepID=A0ABQ5NQL0_9ACTN|nr:alpha/beta hydrolase [Streptomyces sp. YSPA8]GLF92668.1 alpha/beta hydrolase [Streptomyces sp. YSPA8]
MASTGALGLVAATAAADCPASPVTPGPPPGTSIPIAKTVLPASTRSSTVIVPNGPQIQCGSTQVITRQDIVYASPTAGGRQVDLKLDLQIPQTRGPKPLVVYITGGGFVMADKRGNLAQRTYIAEQGYAVASIEYRTTRTGSTYRDGVADVKSAIRYLRAHAGELGIDADKVAVWGQSAGGYLASMTGATNGRAEFEQGDNLDRSSAVQAVVDQFGAGDLARIADDFDAETRAAILAPGTSVNAYVFGPDSSGTVVTDPAANAAADPATYLSRSSAPTVLFHGDSDRIISSSQSLIKLDALRGKHVESARYLVKGADHGDLPILNDPEAARMWSTQKVMGTITRFLDRKLQG